MRLACRLINSDGIGFEYAIVELTPDYAAHLLRLVDEAEKLEKSQDEFYAIELFDHYVEYGSCLHGLDEDTEESLDESSGWVQISDDVELEEESTTAATVAISPDSIHWQAAAKHSDSPVYFETATLTVEDLKRLFPQSEEPKTETHRYILYDHDMGNLATTTVYDDYEEAVEDANRLDNVIILPLEFEQQSCDCELPGHFNSGIPGILAHVENGRLAEGTEVERCDSCERYPTDQAAFDKLVELGITAPTVVEQYVQAGGGFCPECRSDQIEGNSVDFDGPHCTQRMRCLECQADWTDVYVLSDIQD